MHHFVTGVAGFIGSQLSDRLLETGDHVSGVDDFSRGRPEHLRGASSNPRFRFFEGDVSVTERAVATLRSASEWAGTPDVLWHFAANSDIAAGTADLSIDYRLTLQTTFAVLQAARICGAARIAFASTSAVYGERSDVLSEDSGPLLPISHYGAAKLASEALLSAAAETFLDRVWILRFPNVVGPRATHGAVVDFIGQLASRPARLTVLGDGTQTKPYLHVAELIEAMCFVVARAADRRNVFNIGPVGEGTRVDFIAKEVIARVLPGTPIAFTGGDRGWVGDVPRFQYSIERLTRLGWTPRLSSDDAVRRAVDELAAGAVATR